MPDPIDMVLHCPQCGMQHIDAPEPEHGWTNPPHKSHLCAACKYIWRPADVFTNGVLKALTYGEADTPTLPVVVLLREGPQRSELHPYKVYQGQIVSGVSSGVRVGRDRFAVYKSESGSLLLVAGHGELNVVNGAWTLVRNADGTGYCETNPAIKAKLVGYVEDQMEYIGAFSGGDSEDTPHYKELLDAFHDEMIRRGEWP